MVGQSGPLERQTRALDRAAAGWAGWFWVVGAAEEKKKLGKTFRKTLNVVNLVDTRQMTCVRDNDASAVPSGDWRLWTLPFLLLSESQVQNGAARAASGNIQLTLT